MERFELLLHFLRSGGTLTVLCLTVLLYRTACLGATFPKFHSFLPFHTVQLLVTHVEQLRHQQTLSVPIVDLSMPPKQRAGASRGPTPLPADSPSSSPSAAANPPYTRPPPKASSSSFPAQDVLQDLWQRYLDTTPQRAKLIDAFMAFLVVVGVIQFAYCVVAGNYVRPNSFQ